MSDHLIHLRTTFHILRDQTLFVMQSKFTFGVSQMHYVGHVISGQGVVMDPHKVEAVVNWPC